jgi:hypothetical protein
MWRGIMLDFTFCLNVCVLFIDHGHASIDNIIIVIIIMASVVTEKHVQVQCIYVE